MLKKRTKRKAGLNKSQSNIQILAIDPASILGWALSENEYGTWDLRTKKDESIGMKLLRLESKLNEIFELKHPNIIAYERAAGMHKLSIIHQAKLIGIIEQWCERKGVQYRAFSATEIKKFATGKGNAGKPKMIEAAKAKFGYLGKDDNEADALHILDLCKHELNIV